jgi:hypothetical protein
MWVNGETIGSTLTTAGPVTVHIDVQAPRWIAVDRVELYANGTLIHEWSVDDNGDVMRFDETVTVETAVDTWFVAMAMGDGDLAPVFTPVEIPYVDLQEIVTGALAGAEAVADLVAAGPPVPKEYPIRPYALTNPIWIDRDGDGFDAPGIADWLIKP